MRKALVLAAGLVALSVPASARSKPAEHSIPWFMANPATRQATIRACRDDFRIARNPVCANAEAAETRVYALKVLPFQELNSPGYWQGNPGMMAALRTACARRAPYDQPLLRYCGSARTQG